MADDIKAEVAKFNAETSATIGRSLLENLYNTAKTDPEKLQAVCKDLKIKSLGRIVKSQWFVNGRAEYLTKQQACFFFCAKCQILTDFQGDMLTFVDAFKRLTKFAGFDPELSIVLKDFLQCIDKICEYPTGLTSVVRMDVVNDLLFLFEIEDEFDWNSVYPLIRKLVGREICQAMDCEDLHRQEFDIHRDTFYILLNFFTKERRSDILSDFAYFVKPLDLLQSVTYLGVIEWTRSILEKAQAEKRDNSLVRLKSLMKLKAVSLQFIPVDTQSELLILLSSYIPKLIGVNDKLNLFHMVKELCPDIGGIGKIREDVICGICSFDYNTPDHAILVDFLKFLSVILEEEAILKGLLSGNGKAVKLMLNCSWQIYSTHLDDLLDCGKKSLVGFHFSITVMHVLTHAKFLEFASKTKGNYNCFDIYEEFLEKNVTFLKSSFEAMRDSVRASEQFFYTRSKSAMKTFLLIYRLFCEFCQACSNMHLKYFDDDKEVECQKLLGNIARINSPAWELQCSSQSVAQPERGNVPDLVKLFIGLSPQSMELFRLRLEILPATFFSSKLMSYLKTYTRVFSQDDKVVCSPEDLKILSVLLLYIMCSPDLEPPRADLKECCRNLDAIVTKVVDSNSVAHEGMIQLFALCATPFFIKAMDFIGIDETSTRAKELINHYFEVLTCCHHDQIYLQINDQQYGEPLPRKHWHRHEQDENKYGGNLRFCWELSMELLLGLLCERPWIVKQICTENLIEALIEPFFKYQAKNIPLYYTTHVLKVAKALPHFHEDPISSKIVAFIESFGDLN